MDVIKKGYNYSYSFLRISYIFLLRLFYKNYQEKRVSLQDNKETYVENINALFGCCNHIIDNVYLGSSFNASNNDLLNNLKIKRIVNISYDIPNYYEDYIEYYYFKMKDDGIDEYTKKDLDNIIEYIKKNNDNVLIHCMMGRSRSATVVLYYLIKEHNMNLDDALKYILSKRYVVNPSLKFIENIKNILKQNI